jgi:surfactin family lipopeptide synthetase A
VGELYLAGECLSGGYISRDDLTQSAFLPDPFFPGERMYRTGDLGRLRLDGSYDFLGRRDAQVKLNGQRVELEEINGAFVSQGCALQAATVPVHREDGSMELVAYYVPAPGDLSDQELRCKLGQVLPTYMIPSRMISMEALPSTPTGKIDLRALKEMTRSGEENVPQAPSSDPAPSEEEASPGSLEWILQLWRRVLNRQDVAADRSFFDQGGTSLAALSVLSFYNNTHLTLSLAQFYNAPTAAAQAELFSAQGQHTPVPDAAPIALSTVITPMSEYGRDVRLLLLRPHHCRIQQPNLAHPGLTRG